MDFRVLLIDAIHGVGFPSIGFAQHCEQVGVAEFNGDQLNPSWSWKSEALSRFGATELTALYEGLIDERAAVAQAERTPSLLVPDTKLHIVKN